MSKAKEITERLKRLMESPQRLLDPTGDHEADSKLEVQGFELFKDDIVKETVKWLKSTYTEDKLKSQCSKRWLTKTEAVYLLTKIKLPQMLGMSSNKTNLLVSINATGNIVSFILFYPEQIKNSPISSLVFSKVLIWKNEIYIRNDMYMSTNELLAKYVFPIRNSIMSDRDYTSQGEESLDRFIKKSFELNRNVAVYNNRSGEVIKLNDYNRYLETKEDYFNYTRVFRNYQYLIWK